jgi:metal-responsive CopG/Arc/MetJ family transcriptional regulator
MRTTVTLADDVAAAVEDLRRKQSVGLSEAVNELIRAGLVRGRPKERFEQRGHDMGRAMVDYSNVADVEETLEGPQAR